MRRRLDRVLRRLDALPVVPCAVAGAAAGAGAGALLLVDPAGWRLGAFGALALATVPLAYLARPAAAREPASRPPKRPALPEPGQPAGEPQAEERPLAAVVEGPPPRIEPLLDMVPIEGGVFWMGSRDDDPRASPGERPRHRVEVGPFSMGRYLVTQAQFEQVMGHNPGNPKGADIPVNKVSWYDAVAFCNALSDREGLARVYDVAGETVTCHEQAEGYRLPTEAEWEYAARAGTETAWSFGDDEAHLGEHAWFGKNSRGAIQPVGRKKPNPWGLFDVHGNVYEWCWDSYGPYPTPSASGVDRVVRGGSFILDPWFLRSAVRNGYSPQDRDGLIGFRCARGSGRRH